MIAWAVETVIATSLLMLVVLAIRTPVRRHFGPAIGYALWAIPALRMVLPPLPDSWRGAAIPVLPTPQDITIYLGDPVATLPAEAANGFGWPTVVVALWVIGTAGFALWHIIAHHRFCARIRRHADSVTPVAAGNVRVIATDAATGPLAFGVWRKFVAFPRDFAERYDPLEQDLALAHELGHHARGDLIANWIALVILAVHWFNPVAWRAYRAFRADQEMACDALVLAGRARELRAAYGRAIVKSAHGGAVSAACHLHTINEIKGRLKMLGVHDRTTRTRLYAGTAALGALLLTGLGVTASGTAAAEGVRTGVETATGVDFAAMELPRLPALAQDLPPPPPAPPAPRAPGAPGTSIDRQVTVTNVDGKPVKKVRVIMHDKDGVTRTLTDDEIGDLDIKLPEGPGGVKHRFVFRSKDGKPMAWDDKAIAGLSPEMRDRLKNMPEISSRTCTEGEGKGENVIRREDGAKKIVIICTNRIEKMAALSMGEADKAGTRAVVIRRHAETTALEGLRDARRSIEANRDMTDSQRAAALSGIDSAIREMESMESNRKD
ncbi:M56 family metallopeptidase [Sphingomonas donggukensis]|uniref:M56 family metallopeptidase n=1 Tax=Sphingomonas donggukensis TaxID=2949093 RepID=A0ABY4TPU2_9SPHN|nr:M56 family metallopeptidase [Sphingomonas donggukensis]URW74396.1 M56 family metallopeptidase [Sphingomonas donggukensis]